MEKLSKAERKKRAEEKRKKIATEIWDVMQRDYDKLKDFEAACRAGDDYVNMLIRQNPQDRTLIEQAGYMITTTFKICLEKVAAITKVKVLYLSAEGELPVRITRHGSEYWVEFKYEGGEWEIMGGTVKYNKSIYLSFNEAVTFIMKGQKEEKTNSGIWLEMLKV